LVVGLAGLGCAAIGPACTKVVEGAVGIGAGASADGDPTNKALAASKTYESVIDKLTRYTLNMDHPLGKDKAIWFEKALGFTKDNMESLAKQIVFDPKTAFVRGTNNWGTLYNQKVTVLGANGKEIDVIAAWIMLEDGTIKLTNLLPPY